LRPLETLPNYGKDGRERVGGAAARNEKKARSRRLLTGRGCRKGSIHKGNREGKEGAAPGVIVAELLTGRGCRI